MRLSKRATIILLFTVLLGVSVALVVTGGGSRKSVAPMGFYGAENGSAQGVLAAAGDSTTQTSTAQLADPAKQEPVLDKFHSRDPFKPLISQATGSSSATTGGTGGTAQAPTSADIRINGTDYKGVKIDQKVPTVNPQFKITALSATGVTFSLLPGDQFDDGSTSVIVAEGQVVQVKDKSSGKTYTIGVVKLNYGGTSGTSATASTTGAGSGSSGSSLSQAGHSMKVLSIDSRNGTPSVTLAVDGKTYADKKAGDTFATAWGQIRIISIDAQAQTVTLMQGDEQRTLTVNQTFAK